MISLLKRLFIENWHRKLLSLLLAMVIWMVINHSLTVTKTISNVPVKVTDLAPDKTIDGIQANGRLSQKLTLTLTGNRSCLKEITSSDFEVVISAKDKPSEWISSISKKNLVSLHPDVDLIKGLSRISHQEIVLRQSAKVSEKIPILITHPIGEAPKGYQFLDVWPYQLSLQVSGPEELVKQLKNRGLKLSFNLSDISLSELQTLEKNQGLEDEVSFFVPNSWKKILIPTLSDTPYLLDDPSASALRIDFSKEDLLPLDAPVPITIFYPPKNSEMINPETYQLQVNDFVKKIHGVKMIQGPFYVKGVSRLFLETVKDRLQLVVIASPKTEREKLLWNVQILYPHELENRYVSKMMAESFDNMSDILPHMREDYLRNRFRSYMNRFRLYTPDHKKLTLKIELGANTISVTPGT